MKNYKWKFTPWASWNIERYENFLEKQALSGWIIEKTSCSFLFSRFIRNNPQHLRYGIDYQLKINSDYQSILQDDGWSLVDFKGGWYLWMKAYKEERQSLFTDRQSLVDRKSRLLYVHAIILLIQLPILSIFFKRITESTSFLWNLFTYFYFLVLGLLLISAVLIIVSNARFKKDLLKE